MRGGILEVEAPTTQYSHGRHYMIGGIQQKYYYTIKTERILERNKRSFHGAEGQIIPTDADTADILEHRPMWAHCTVSGGRGIHGQV